MKYIVTFFSIMVAAIIAHPAHAYTTTGQTAFTVNGTVGVYVIDFAFGHEKYAIHIPVAAQRTDTPTADALAYNVLNANGTPFTGNTVGIVLSSAEVVDGEYVIPKGTRASLRLLVLTINGAGDAGNFRTQVTHLPFSFDGKQELSLNPSELTYYTTGYPERAVLPSSPIQFGGGK